MLLCVVNGKYICDHVWFSHSIVHAAQALFWWTWWWVMRTTEIFISPSPPCRLLNLALSAAQFPQPLPYAQVKIYKRTPRMHLAASISLIYLLLSPGSGECLEHGYLINSRYQVVYPFPTFQPAFQLKKDQVILLNTSYSLVACGISLCSGNADIHANWTSGTFLCPCLSSTCTQTMQYCQLSKRHYKSTWIGHRKMVRLGHWSIGPSVCVGKLLLQ